MSNNYRFETLQLHVGQEHPDPTTDARAVPIYATTSYVFQDAAQAAGRFGLTEGGNIYTRLMNPTSDVLEQRLAALESGAAALMTASGAAAITYAVQNIAVAGDHIVSSPVLYGGVYDYFKHELPRFGVEVTFVEFDDPAKVEAAIRPNTKVVYTETISNPLMEVNDLPAIAGIAHAHGCKLVVDNTFATAAVARPLSMDADIVVYSATKYLGGHSDLIGGAVVSDKENIAQIHRCFTLYGAIMGPMEAWLLCRSLRTLDLRMEQHSKNALKVARFLEGHPKVEKVYYPGLESSPSHGLAAKLFVDGRCGGMLSADIAGGEQGASALIRECSTIKFVPSLASFATTISYPAKTSHRAYSPEDMKAAGISMGQLRFSIGLEDAEDIIAELDEALEKV